MEISYSSIKLEKILTNERLIKKNYTAFYKNIINRMSEIRLANNLDEIPHIPPPRRHKLDREYSDCWGIDISKNYRIILEPMGDWELSNLKTINKIKIISIEDYH